MEPSNQESSLFRFTQGRVSKILTLAIFIILLFVSGWIGYQYGSNTQDNVAVATPSFKVPEKLDTLDQVFTEPFIFTSNTKNLSFIIPAGWKHISSPSHLPQGAENPWFVIEHPETGCYIANGKFSWNMDTHRQVSFADRVLGKSFQYDGNWLVPISVSESAPFADHERQYLNNEVRVSFDARNDEFYLWQKEGLPVPNTCNDALNQLLETVEFYFAPIQLSSTSTGSLWVMHDHAERGQSPQKSYLVITLPTGESFKVLDLPLGINWSGVMTVYENKIYGIVNTGKDQIFTSQIMVIDPLQNSVTPVKGLESIKGYVSSLTIFDDSMYYVLGETDIAQCAEYSVCGPALYSIPVTGGDPTLLAEHTAFSKIKGYSREEDAIYFVGGNGDAGCFSVSVHTYTLHSRVTKLILQESGCADDGSEGNAVSYMEELEKKMPSSKSFPAIEINGGMLTPSNSLLSDESYTNFVFLK